VRTRPLLPVAFAILAFTAASCGDDDSEATTDTPAVTAAATEMTTETPAVTEARTEATTGAAADAPMEAAVDIADFAFGPTEITIAAGGTVTWTNTDDQAHTATSSGNFDTGSIDPDATASVTFDEPGTFTYICSFHPFMTATVTVV
jgi:plastocyanin